ncbi:MAG: RAD55 family ATPase [Candidatus Helarchaeota archaeon]
MEVIRIDPGIPGLKDKLEGGFIFPSLVLVIGQSGVGKTIFSFQYLFEGAKHKEKGLYFSTLSEPVSSLIKYGSTFWFFNSKAIGKRVFLIDVDDEIKKFRKGSEFLSFFIDKIESYNINRIVIDPINPISYSLTDVKEYRTFMFELSKYIKENEIQALMTAELHGVGDFHCHESFIADGTILLEYARKDRKISREMTIVKMRGTYHPLEPFPYIITKNGITIQAKTKTD